MDTLELLTILHPSIDEDLLALLLNNARQDVMNYCHIQDFPDSIESTLLEMVEENINKLGAQGYQSENTGGNSITYLTDYSDKVYKVLNRYKRPVLVE